MALKLPSSVTSTQDVHRLRRELEALDNYLHQSQIRDGTTTLPRLTNVLEALARDNELDLSIKETRNQLSSEVAQLLKTAPVIHISFAVEPPSVMTQKIAQWFRQSVDPRILLQVGIQPTIAAGCVLRTPNKYFDFSLRQHLQSNQAKLMESIRQHSEVTNSNGAGK